MEELEIVLRLKQPCRISVGAKLVISALCFWLAAGCSSFVAHKAEKEETVDPLHEPLSA